MKQSSKLFIVLLLNIFIITALLLVGNSSNSLGVLAAAGDYLVDCSAIILGLMAIRIKQRKGVESNATTIVALINSLTLIILTAYFIFQALHRLSGPPPKIEALPVLIVSSIAAVVMLIGAFIIGDDDDDLHMRSVLIDTFADAMSAGALAIAGAIILIYKRFYWVDSALALIIGIFIAYQATKLLREVIQELQKG